MIPFFKQVFTDLEDQQIPYIVGAESLVGMTEGDLCKYSHNLRLYLFPLSKGQVFRLALRLLRHRIILKPKKNKNHRFYKLRYKPGLFKKAAAHVNLTLLTPSENGYSAFVGGHNTYFKDSDLNLIDLQKSKFDGISILLPRNPDEFVKTYKKELLAGFYKKHDIAFDSNSEKRAVQFMHQNIAIMNSVGISFWVEGGTLLGALRNQKLIPWDHDLDFGMKFESEVQMKQLIRNLRRKFHVSVKDFPKTHKIWQLGKYRVLKIYPRKHLFLKDELCLDLFVYYKGELPGSTESVYKYVVWNRNAYHRREFLDTQESLVFYGKPVPVPANPQGFIEVKYGKDWRIPVKEWNVALDDGSVYKSE